MMKGIYLTRKCIVCGKAAYFRLSAEQCAVLKKKDTAGIGRCFTEDEAAWLRTGLCPACREYLAGIPAYMDTMESPKGTEKEKNYGI